MANPVVVECQHNVVKQVKSNTLSCDVLLLDSSKEYFQTYRVAGDASPSAPTNPNDPRIPASEEWVEMNEGYNSFRPSELSDLYIYCTSGDKDKSGFVRIDS